MESLPSIIVNFMDHDGNGRSARAQSTRPACCRPLRSRPKINAGSPPSQEQSLALETAAILEDLIRKHDQTKERLFQQPLIRQDYIRGAGAFCVNGGNASNGAITASMFGQRPRSKPRRRAAHRLRKLEDSGDRRPTGESESSLPAPRYQSLDRFELFKAEVRHYISVVRYRYTDTQRQQSQPRLLQPQGRAPAARQVR